MNHTIHEMAILTPGIGLGGCDGQVGRIFIISSGTHHEHDIILVLVIAHPCSKDRPKTRVCLGEV